MKTKGIDIDTGSEKRAKINWGKIVGGAANGASALFEPVMPVTIGTVSNATSLMRDLRNATRAAKTTTRREQSNIRNSANNKRSLSLFKSAFSDIEAGNYKMEKINDDLFEDYESDTAGSFKMPTGDDAVGMSSEEILLIGNKGVAQSVIQSSSAQLRGLRESSKALINANIKSTQALGLSINNTLQFGFNAINTNLTIQNQKLDSVNRNLSSLIEFNNRNAIQFYSKSIDMMAGIGKMMDNLEKSMRPAARKKDRIFDTSNGFDIREYGKYIKEGIKESLVGTGISTAKNVGKDFGIMGIISELIIPKAIKEPLAKFDKSINRFFKEGFKRLGEELNKHDLLQALGIGDIFGSKRSKINSMDLGKYMKDATPWNGIAQKALVEVIPELLTSIDSKLDNSERRYYDYGKGQFKNRSKIEEDFRNEYFDTFSMALRDSMEKLTEVAQATGRSDTDRLIAAIQGLIDDQVSGSKDEMSTRREIESEMKKFGVNATGIKDFIMELTDGLDDAISRINDLYHEVGSTQHIYRNINNTAGREYSKTIKDSHKARNSNYGAFSFMSSYGYGLDPKSAIQSLQKKAGINDIDLSDDVELQRNIMVLMEKKAKESELITLIKRAASSRRYSEKAQSKFKFVRTFKNRAETLGGRISRGSENILNPMFKRVYLDEWGRPIKVEDPSTVSSQGSPKSMRKVKVTKRKVKSAASTALTTQLATVSSKEERNFRQLNELNEDSYKDFIDKSESEIERDHNRMSTALTELSQAKPSSTLEGSIAQSTNSLKSFLSALMVSFKSFTSSLFGKDGLFKRLWQSNARKKVTDKIKTKLFTGENAIFKKQYEGAKAGMKKLKLKTLAHLGRGYDYLYDNTMQYMYGAVDENGNPISYKDSESYQNNKFVSQTLNRRWRRNNKRRKNREAYEAKHSKNSSTSDNTQQTEEVIPNQKAHAELLGLPAPSQRSPENRDKLITRLGALKHIMREGRKNNPKYSTEETQQATEEYKMIKKKLSDPIESAELAIIDTTKKYEIHTKAAVETMVGDIDESPAKKEKAYKESFLAKLKKAVPKSLAGAIAGAGVGLLNSKFSLLGGMFLPGGPISGAIVGGGLSILKNTEAFQSLMYGKLNEKTGKREGGLISEQLRVKLKKMAPFAIGGAVLGGLKGILTSSLGFNGGLGILGMQLLPGGALGGALLGASIGILKNSDTFKDLLFGKKDKDGKRSGTFISNSFNKARDAFKAFIPKVKKAGAGLGVGALTGTILSKAGFIPAMFSLGGPVGMGITGLGLGIAASTSRFNDWMFGTKDPETGKRRKDGILSRMTNLLRVNMIEPIGDAFKKQLLDLVDYTKLQLFAPFKLVFGPIVDSIKGIKDNIVDFVKEKFEQVGNGILSIMKNTIKTVFSPLTKAMSWVGKSIIGLTGAVAKGAVGLLGAPLQVLRVATAGKRGKEYADFYKNYYGKGNISGTLREKWAAEEAAGNKRNIFQKMSDAVGAYTGQGEVADAAREGWNAKMREEGKDHLLWRETGQQNRKIKAERKRRHEEERKWSKIDKQRRKIVDKDLGGREGVTLTDYQFEKYRDKFRSLGVDEKFLQSSDDIIQLLYHREDFKKRLNPISDQGKDKAETEDGIKLIESKEQKEAREATEQYQKSIKDILSRMAERMGVAAIDHLAEDKITSAEEDFKKSKRNLSRRANRAGIKINLSNPELEDWNIDELRRDELDDYRLSEFYKTGDIIGFMKSKGFTQKSKYRSNPIEDPQATSSASMDVPLLEAGNEKGWAWRFNRATSSNAPNVKKSNPITELLSKIGNTMNDLLNVNKEQRDLASVQVEEATNGEMNAGILKRRKGKPLGARLISKFDALTRFLGFKKKKKRDDDEDAESEAAREGTDSDDESDDESGDKKSSEEKGIFGKLWDKIKSIGSAIGGTLIGGFLFKAVKTAGTIGLLGGLGMTIAELIRPGTAKKVGASIDAFNNYIQDEEFSMKKVFTDFSEWFNSTFIGKWWGKTVTPWWNEKVQPWVDKVGIKINAFLDNLPETMKTWATNAGSWITKNTEKLTSAICSVATEIVPPLVEVVVKTFPTLVKSVGEGILRGMGLIKDPVKDSSVSDTEAKIKLETSGTHTRKNEMTTKSAVSTATAYSKLNSSDEAERNSVIVNASTGQYYIYDSTKQTQERKYLDEDAAMVLMSDPETAANVWVDPVTGEYFIEEATYTQYGSNVYVTLDGKAKVQKHRELPSSVHKVGLQMTTRALRGLPAISKGARGVVKGAGYIAKYGGKTVTGVGKGVSKLGLLMKPAGWAMQAGGKGMTAAGKGMIKLSEAGTKTAGKTATKTGTKLATEFSEAAAEAGSKTKPSFIQQIKNYSAKLVGKKNVVENTVEAASDIAEAGTKKAATTVTKTGAKLTNTSTKSAMKTVKSVADVVDEVADKECVSIFQKMSKMFQGIKNNKTIIKIFDKFSKMMTFSVGDFLGKMVKWLDDIALKCSGKAVGKFASKVSAKVASKLGKGALTNIPLITVISAAWGLVDGALSAANLFEVPQEDVDWKMVLISSLMEGLLSISIGCWIDLLMDLADLLIGFDLKHEIAVFLYKLLSGNSAEAYEKLQKSQENLSLEASIYNALNGTNMDTKSYNDKQNKGLIGKIGSGIKAGWNWITGNGDKNYVESGDAYSDYLKILTGANYTTDQISKMSTAEIKAAIQKHVGSSSLDEKTKTKVTNSLKYFTSEGYGPDNGVVRVNSLYAQGDSRWANMPIGRLPDGSVATMGKAGCGPTALAAVANTVASRNVGYGPITPADIGAYAASNGYISQGGANAGLFTEGAAAMGLSSHPINNAAELKDNLLAGKPTILSGKSNDSSSDPYTSAGHIVMADGIYGNRMSVLDPIDGKRKLYDIDDISKNTNHAWSYSAGYGRMRPALRRIAEKNAEKKKAEESKTTAVAGASGTITPLTTVDTTYISSPVRSTAGIIYSTSSMNYSELTDAARQISNINSSGNPNAGITDSGITNGYNTDGCGLDIELMINNYNYFMQNDTYFHEKYGSLIKKHNEQFENRANRIGRLNIKVLSYILSTQYFGLEGGKYGSITIAPKWNGSAYQKPMAVLNKDLVANIFAAAILSEYVYKGNTFITAPLSSAEKFAAFCNACRVMFGLANTLELISNFSLYSPLIDFMEDYEYESIVTYEINLGNEITSALNDALTPDEELSITLDETESGGIRNAEELKQIAMQKGFLGKIGLLGKIAQAKMNSILNGGTDFWTEFSNLTESDKPTTSAIVQGGSSILKSAIKNPKTIQDELLGKTIENIYRGESGGNYASVRNDTNNLASVGPYQANGKNAVQLLKDLQNAQGISSDLRKKFGEYANIINLGKALDQTQIDDLSSALADSEYSTEIKKAIDRNAMEFQRDLYDKHYSGYYDNDIIKDLRTLPLLADIGNTNPNLISDTSNTKSFMYNWTPVSKEKDFEKAFELLNSPSTYWKSSKYSTGYMKRVKDTYDNLRNYAFKKADFTGNLRDYFDPETNPLGYGDTDAIITNSEKLQKFNSTMNAVGDTLITHLASKLGVDPSDLGFNLSTSNDAGGITIDATSTTSTTPTTTTQSSSTNSSGGTATKSGDVLTSISGSDRARFLAAAKSQIGYLEKTNASDLKSFKANPGNENYSKYAQEIGGWNGGGDNGAKWCNFFTSWVGKAAGIPTSVMYRGGYVPTTIDKFKNLGSPLKSPSSYIPKAGDLIIYDYDGTRTNAQHIGIVESVANGKVNTIEGNIKSDYNGGTVGSVATRSRDLSYSGIMGYIHPPWTGETKTVDPRELLSLGYGPSRKTTRIDSPAYREQLRKSIENQEEFKVTPKDFEAIGFGPGMAVDAGFDMSSTDGKLDQIFGVIAEWFAESKKHKPADSAATTNVNMIRANTTNVSPTTSASNDGIDIHKYRENLVNRHVILSAKTNVKNTI